MPLLGSGGFNKRQEVSQMKKIVAAAVAALAFSVSAQAAQPGKGLQRFSGILSGKQSSAFLLLPDFSGIPALHKGGLFAGKETINGLPVALYTGAYVVTAAIPVVSRTPLPGLIMERRAMLRNGNT